jgi:biopolymer transport protein ExbD
MDDPTKEGESTDTETINVVPLADLTLVLLVILMVISPMISQTMIHVSAPAVKSDKELKEEEKPKPDEKASEPLMIMITPSGYTLNNAPTASLEELVNAVAARLAEIPERPVLVTADKTVTVGAVVHVLDGVKMKEPEIAQVLGRPEFNIRLSLLKQPELEGGRGFAASPITKGAAK